MATKTISVRLDAYERLRNARRHPKESFSEVILRASWEDAPITGGELLALYAAGGPFLSEEALDRVDELKASDTPPEDKWQDD